MCVVKNLDDKCETYNCKTSKLGHGYRTFFDWTSNSCDHDVLGYSLGPMDFGVGSSMNGLLVHADSMKGWSYSSSSSFFTIKLESKFKSQTCFTLLMSPMLKNQWLWEAHELTCLCKSPSLKRPLIDLH